MASENRQYIPGTCNIGPAETRQRMQAGWLGLGVTIVMWVLFIIFRVSAPWRLFLFLPAALSATGFLQAAFHFCANFGMRGVFNFGDEVGKTESVTQAEFRRKDRMKAQRIIFYSALLGVAVALIGYFTAV
ncbi:hypothetical protein [Salinispira pacifica]